MSLSYWLATKFTADTSQLESGMKRASKSVSRTGESFKKAQKQAQFFAKAIAGAAVVGSVMRLSRSAFEMAERLDNVSRKLGVSTDFLQTFGFAARETGVKTEAAEMGLQRFIRRLGEAQQGLGELLPVIKQYGIELQNSDGSMRSAEDVLRDYADVIMRAGTQQEKLRLAFKAFDSEGAGLVTVLKDGAEGLDDWVEAARRAGQILGDETIPRLAEAKRQIEAWNNALVIMTGETIGAFFDAWNKMPPWMQAIIMQKTGPIIQPMINAAESSANPPGIDLPDIEDTGSLDTVADQTSAINDRYLKLTRLIGTEQELQGILQRRIEIYADLSAQELERNGVTDEYLKLLEEQIKAEDEVREIQEKSLQWMDSLADGIENGLLNATREGKRAFGDMADFIIAELQRMLIKWMLFQAFTGLGGMIGGTPGGMLTSFGNKFGGGKASGGRVTGGTTYLVGERGPELVTMGANGYVTPNDKIGGGPTFNVDMRGASVEAVARLERFVAQLHGSIERRAVAASQDQRFRNPSFLTR